jgi:hypothetical protein
MFSLLRAAFTLLICILVIGFFLGWFTFTRTAADPQSNKVNINVSVDKTKMGSDLQNLEQKVSKQIQDLNNQPPGGNPPAQQGNNPPRLFLGPLPLQPSQPGGQPGGPQSGMPTLSLGPISLQPSEGTPAPPTAPLPAQTPITPDYQLGLPLGVPPPGEGR